MWNVRLGTWGLLVCVGVFACLRAIKYAIFVWLFVRIINNLIASVYLLIKRDLFDLKRTENHSNFNSNNNNYDNSYKISGSNRCTLFFITLLIKFIINRI